MTHDSGSTVGDRAQTRRRAVGAPFALPAGFAALLLIGAIAAGTHGALSASWVLALAAVVTGVAALAEPGAALFVAVAAWFTTAGFSSSPYAQLRVTWVAGGRCPTRARPAGS